MSSHRLLASLVGMFSLVLAGCGGGDGEPGGTVASDPPRQSTTASSPTAGLVPTSEAAEQPTRPIDRPWKSDACLVPLQAAANYPRCFIGAH